MGISPFSSQLWHNVEQMDDVWNDENSIFTLATMKDFCRLLDDGHLTLPDPAAKSADTTLPAALAVRFLHSNNQCEWQINMHYLPQLTQAYARYTQTLHNELQATDQLDAAIEKAALFRMLHQHLKGHQK